MYGSSQSKDAVHTKWALMRRRILTCILAKVMSGNCLFDFMAQSSNPIPHAIPPPIHQPLVLQHSDIAIYYPYISPALLVVDRMVSVNHILIPIDVWINDVIIVVFLRLVWNQGTALASCYRPAVAERSEIDSASHQYDLFMG